MVFVETKETKGRRREAQPKKIKNTYSLLSKTTIYTDRNGKIDTDVQLCFQQPKATTKNFLMFTTKYLRTLEKRCTCKIVISTLKHFQIMETVLSHTMRHSRYCYSCQFAKFDINTNKSFRNGFSRHHIRMYKRQRLIYFFKTARATRTVLLADGVCNCTNICE